jgi:nicotinamide mononucleotide transporter
LLDTLIAAFAAVTPLETVSVVLGLAYSILAVKRSRWCWIAGGISSAILVYLSAVAHLPMQATLQAYYVAMSFYGFWQWSKQQQVAPLKASTWPLRSHLIAWLVILLASAISARWLAAETQAAWPFLDSVTTWACLLATWLVARMKLENWLYWIATDSVLVFLFVRQGSIAVATLFAAYLIISVFGFVSWLKTYRQPATAG